MGSIVLTLKQRLSGLVVLFNRLVAAFSHDTQLHTARFARIDELVSLLGNQPDQETSLLLGVSHLSHVLRVRPTPVRRELGNLLVVAPPRGGKGLLAVSQLLTWPHSVIVNDIKGELFTQTAGYRSKFGQVFVFDTDGIGHRYDPLVGRTSEKDLLSSATNLLYKEKEAEPIFTERAITMLTQLFLAARIEGFSPLPYTRTMIRQGLFNAASRLQAVSPALATQFLDTDFSHADFKDKFLLSCWGTLCPPMRRILTDTSVKCFAGWDFTARDIIASPTPVTVYLRWPEQDLLALSPLARLVWKSLIDEMTSTYDKITNQNSNSQLQNVLLLVDEAGVLGIPDLHRYASKVNGRGISLWLAIQSLSQLDALYGHHRADTIRNDCDSQIYYRQASQETAEYLERCLGKRSGFAQSETTHEGANASQGLSEQGIPLMTAQAIKQMRDDELIGFHRSLPPFRAKRMDWRRFPIFTQRRRILPPPLSALPKLEESLPPLAEQGRGEPPNEYIDPDL